MGNIFACIDDLTKQDNRVTYDMSVVKTKNLPIIWLLGPPGSGRTTQSHVLAEKFGYDIINVADLIKKEANVNSERGVMVKEAVKDKHKKVPDDLVIDLIKEDMLKTVNDSVGYVINGFPKTNKQASLFVKQIKDVDAVLYLYLETLKMVARIREKEENVEEEDIKNEIFSYVKEVKEGTAKFATKVEKIYTDGPPAEVFQKIESVLNVRLKVKSSAV